MAMRGNLPEIWRGSVWGHSPRELTRLQRHLDRVFEEFFGAEEEVLGFVPPVDIHETDSHYLLSVDLPGVSKEDVKIEVRGNQLHIFGERKAEMARKEGRRLGTERFYGVFQRSFTLPAALEPNQVEANFESGVLEIAIPKVEVGKTKKLQIGEQKGGIFKKLLSPGEKEVKAEKAEKAEKAA